MNESNNGFAARTDRRTPDLQVQGVNQVTVLAGLLLPRPLRGANQDRALSAMSSNE